MNGIGGPKAMVKILYIEDNEDNIYMVSRRLRRKGYEVVVARDGAEGLARAKSQLPDLILMDLGLPVIDGWEVTRRLRAAPETATVPIVAPVCPRHAGGSGARARIRLR
ncbi:CheY-like chemotaxis protein [Bradyrhizobium sp. USDA 4523]